MIGTKLAHYEITSHLGTGGMGEVYQAMDSKLGRSVAIKLLPEAFARDADRLARFEREARVLASLNHPHIAAIYGLEESGGRRFLVMELAAGETLAARISRGPIPLDEALKISAQIAEALEAAHEKGVMHRDLKPANIKITQDGHVKVLDFGLAKAFEGEAGNLNLSNSPTISMEATHAGVILGTAAYMSPEQAKGRPVDKRTDIFAFGVVLYEMLTGGRLHQGDSISEVLASVIKETPDLNRVPARVRPLLRSCLQKDPQQRLHDIADAMVLIESTPEAAPAQIAPHSPARWLWPSVAAVLAIGLAAATWIIWRTPPPADLPLIHLDVDLGADIVLPPPVTFVSNVVISQDGTRLAYIASTVVGGPSKLFTRRIDNLSKATDLQGTEGAQRPFFSRDGNWIGFNVGRRLYTISVEGGPVVLLMDLKGNFAGAAWGEDGIIVAQQGTFLVKIPEGGGPATPVTEWLKGEVIQSSPQILPGGKAILFSSNSGIDATKASIEIVTLTDHKRKRLFGGAAYPRFVAESKGAKGAGYLLYVVSGAMFAIHFDSDKLEVSGTPFPVLGDVTGAAGVPGKFDVSLTGTLVYQKGSGAAMMTTIQWIDSTGKSEPLLARPGIYWHPRLSPEGKRVALAAGDGAIRVIQVYELQSQIITPLSPSVAYHDYPVWSPDGKFVVFSSGQGGMFWARADGSGQPQPLTTSTASQRPWSFFGNRLAFWEQEAGRVQIWTMPLEEQGGQLKPGTAEPFQKDQFDDYEPAFSADGKWLAYSSNEAGAMREVIVRPFPPPASGQGQSRVVSSQGGQHPVWAKQDLLFQSPGGQTMAAHFSVKGGVFDSERPRVWLAKPIGLDFDLSADGNSLAVVTPVAAAGLPTPAHIMVFIQNFFAELRRKVLLGR